VKKQLSLLLVVAVSAALVSFAQSPEPSPSTDVSFEELPELNASDILKPEVVKGLHHTVREPVSTWSGANRFTIDSEFGVFEAEGNEMLLRRINEINAIAKLKEISRTDEYKAALMKSAKAPVEAVKRIASDPMGTISSAPKGLMKFMRGAGESIKNVGKKSDDSDKYEGSKLEQMSGYTDTKRKVAINLGVDPYSSNAVLQHELNEIAKAAFLGGATFSVVTLPVGGAAGIGLTTTEISNSLEETLREKSPADLKALNRKYLLGMGASQKEADRFFANGAFSPTAQTAFVLNLQSLEGVANRRAFIKLATDKSSTEADAIFCIQTAALMSQLHKGDVPLARIGTLGEFPICIAKDGSVVVALQWDYAAWTPNAAAFADSIERVAGESGRHKHVLVALSGQASPRLRQELQNLGFTLRDRMNPGPLK
jgi:hypothetical protein